MSVVGFTNSGTGLESAIQAGSGGLSQTGTSVEVNQVPSDLSEGAKVKVAIGSSSDWSGGAGEMAHGVVGTLGSGANGGTNINSLSRGREGTSAQAWSEGDEVRVGVQGRNDAAIHRTIMAGDFYYPTTNLNDLASTALFANGHFLAHHGIVHATIESPSFYIYCGSAGGSSGESRFKIFNPRGDTKLVDEVVDLTTTGPKEITTSQVFARGEYLFGVGGHNYSSNPSIRASGYGHSNPGWPSKNLDFPDNVGYRVDQWDPQTINVRWGSSKQNKATVAVYYKL